MIPVLSETDYLYNITFIQSNILLNTNSCLNINTAMQNMQTGITEIILYIVLQPKPYKINKQII